MLLCDATDDCMLLLALGPVRLTTIYTLEEQKKQLEQFQDNHLLPLQLTHVNVVMIKILLILEPRMSAFLK